MREVNCNKLDLLQQSVMSCKQFCRSFAQNHACKIKGVRKTKQLKCNWYYWYVHDDDDGSCNGIEKRSSNSPEKNIFKI